MNLVKYTHGYAYVYIYIYMYIGTFTILKALRHILPQILR
jgi:hypothetical protein